MQALAFLAAAFLICVAAVKFGPRSTSNFFLCAASTVFGLAAIEAYAVEASNTHISTGTANIEKVDAVLGWSGAKSWVFREKVLSPRGSVIYDAAYTIDKDLFRKTTSCNSGKTIAFVGDSMTFGLGVNDSETLPQQFANDARGMRVLNFGWSGYGPQQVLREIQTGRLDSEVGKNIKAFVFLTAGFHAERTSCKAFWMAGGPRYVLENGKLKLSGSCNNGWVHRLLKKSAAYSRFIVPITSRLNAHDIDTYIAITDAVVKAIKERYGVPTIILYISHVEKLPKGITDSEIVARFKQADPYVLDVSLPPRTPSGEPLRIVGDGHPTGLANSLRASQLKSFISRNFGKTPETCGPPTVAGP